MSDLIVYFLPPMLGIILFVIGLMFEEYITGLFGGLLIFLFGVGILISNIPELSVLHNQVLGSVCIGVGAYIWIRGSLERISGAYSD